LNKNVQLLFSGNKVIFIHQIDRQPTCSSYTPVAKLREKKIITKNFFRRYSSEVSFRKTKFRKDSDGGKKKSHVFVHEFVEHTLPL
jgi:hypothetical protein